MLVFRGMGNATFEDCPGGFGMQVPFEAISGQTYSVKVGGDYREQEGPFSLSIVDPNGRPPAPPATGTNPQTSGGNAAKKKCKKAKKKRAFSAKKRCRKKHKKK